LSMSVADRGRAIATFRSVSVRLMEMTAAWTPTTPELEVKVLLGRHIWDFAQHADALGRRTFELRLPPQHSLSPSDPYAALLADVAGEPDTAIRLSHLYAGLLPGLAARYESYVAETDPILDSPSHVVIDRILGDLKRQRQDAVALSTELGIELPDAAPLRQREQALSLVAPVS